MKTVDIIVPVYNEEEILEEKMTELHNYLGKNCSFPWQVTVVSNGSTDRTPEIGAELSKKLPNLKFVHIPQKGKAKAIRHGWENSTADIVGFMDADLATGLDAVQKCVDFISKGGDMAVGCRHAPGSVVERSLKRSVISHGYKWVVRLFFPFTKIKDAACGFKFASAKASKVLLPKVKNDKWFFDSELLLLAENEGLDVGHIPVSWSEGKKSKVSISRVVTEYVLNLAKLRLRLWFGWK
jgi:glycosyltransferase involved in cell wall biosynthesis